jgi:hypothetical protein
MIKNITIGSDPEFFIFKENKPLSSIGIIEGTKRKPVEVEPGYAILKDNVLVEGNVPPTTTKEDFVNSIKQLKKFIQDVIYPNKLVCADSAEFDIDQLNNREAMLFGCAPYFNAWTMMMNSPADLANFNTRVAGMHIHMGYEYNGPLSKDYLSLYIARAFDYFIVYPSRQIYEDKFRAKYYGDYGNFRITPWGTECRSLGGYFAQDQYLEWIYDQTIKTLEYCNNPDNIKLLENVTSPDNPDKNIKESYKFLNIDLEEQIYGNITNNKSNITILQETF